MSVYTYPLVDLQGPTGPSGATGPSGGPTGPTGVSIGAAPLTASSIGTPGQLGYDGSYIYVCVSTNTWKRAALSSW